MRRSACWRRSTWSNPTKPMLSAISPQSKSKQETSHRSSLRFKFARHAADLNALSFYVLLELLPMLPASAIPTSVPTLKCLRLCHGIGRLGGEIHHEKPPSQYTLFQNSGFSYLISTVPDLALDVLIRAPLLVHDVERGLLEIVSLLSKLLAPCLRIAHRLFPAAIRVIDDACQPSERCYR